MRSCLGFVGSAVLTAGTLTAVASRERPAGPVAARRGHERTRREIEHAHVAEWRGSLRSGSRVQKGRRGPITYRAACQGLPRAQTGRTVGHATCSFTGQPPTSGVTSQSGTLIQAHPRGRRSGRPEFAIPQTTRHARDSFGFPPTCSSRMFPRSLPGPPYARTDRRFRCAVDRMSRYEEIAAPASSRSMANGREKRIEEVGQTGWHACAGYDTQVPRQGSKGFAAISPGAVFASKQAGTVGRSAPASEHAFCTIDEQPGPWAVHA
jgi:hypothetical protein